jgi:hypothetical protein
MWLVMKCMQQWFSGLINLLVGVKYPPLDPTMKGRSNPLLRTLMPYIIIHSVIVLPHTHTSPKFLLQSGLQSIIACVLLFVVL